MLNTSFRTAHLRSLPRSHISERKDVIGKLPATETAGQRPRDLDQPNFSAQILRSMPKGHYSFKGNRYFSRSEAACAELMRKYLGFSIEDKKTVNVPVGVSDEGHVQSVDFKIGQVLIEYHPMIIRRASWRNASRAKRKELNMMHSEIRSRSTSRRRRTELRECVQDQITEQYTSERTSILSKHPDFRKAELIVARSPEDFYDKVLARFAPLGILPDRSAVLAEFKSIQSKCKDLSSKGKEREKARATRRAQRERRKEMKAINRASRYARAS